MARMPRGIGTSTGVKLTRTRSSVRPPRFCRISGVCRCTPPTPYAEAEPITSLPSRLVLGALPAPLVPEAATTTRSSACTSPAATAGREDEGGDRRVAAGYGDPARSFELRTLAGQLGQAVGPRPRVVGAVELLPGLGVGQPEVGAAVDDHGVVAELLGDRTGLAVRQGEEDDVVAGEGLGAGLLEHPVGQRHQVRLQHAEALARVGPAGEGADLDVGVAEQQAEDLAPGVPTGSGDGDTCAWTCA